MSDTENKTAQVPVPVVPVPVVPESLSDEKISENETPRPIEDSPLDDDTIDLPERTIPIKNAAGETPLPSGMPAHSELNLKNVQIPKELIPNTENLGKLKRWGLKHYRVNRQRIQELMGTATITTEPELEPRVEKLQEQLTRYKELHQLGEELATRFNALTVTQKKMGDFFSEMSLKSKDLQEEFTYNADTQRALSKNGETLTYCLSAFNNALHTLIFKTMEDTVMTLKDYKSARVEFDAYRTDLEKLQQEAGPNAPPNHDERVQESVKSFEMRKEKLDKFKDSLMIKLKLLDENRHKVMAKQLLLLHNGVSAYFAGNQQALEGAIQQFSLHSQKNETNSPRSFLENVS